MPSRSLLRQIIGIDSCDFRAARKSPSLLTESLRPLEAFIQQARERLGLFKVGNVADLVCLKAIPLGDTRAWGLDGAQMDRQPSA